MLRLLTTLLGLTLLLSTCGAQNDTNQPTAIPHSPADFTGAVDAYVQQYLDLDIFSGVVLIAERGRPIYHQAFGLATREAATPNRLTTRFDIGSMNKSMTKVLILKLVTEGKLQLDDKLGQYLSGFPTEAAEQINVEQLLNHESGYGDYHTPEYWEIPLEEKSLQTALSYIQQQPLLFEPGTEREYSNAGYVLLGLIAEQATGKSYYDLIESYVLQPLGLDGVYLRDKYSVPERAIGYYKNFRGELQSNEEFGEIPTPAGGFYATAADMLTFYRAYHYGEELWTEQERQLDEMYAFYEQHQSTGGAMTHAGGFEGANTVHYEILRDQISVVVFANMDEPVAENLGLGLLAIIRGKTPEPPALPARQLVYQAWSEEGPAYVKQHWESLITNFHPQDPEDIILNMIGYDLLFQEEVDEAVAIFKLNTELFPEVANCWDSYGEGLLAQGKQAAALAAYQRALVLDPGLQTAKAAIARIKE